MIRDCIKKKMNSIDKIQTSRVLRQVGYLSVLFKGCLIFPRISKADGTTSENSNQSGRVGLTPLALVQVFPL